MNTRSKSKKAPAASDPDQPVAKSPEHHPPDNAAEVQPTRRSQRLIARRSKQHEQEDEPGAVTACDAPAPGPAAAIVPLRRPATGRRLPARPVKRVCREPQLTGLWDTLPTELVDIIINFCGPRQLARLETTCTYFKTVRKLDSICFERLKAIPRAKGMQPNRR
jgi:hypothetical protein